MSNNAIITFKAGRCNAEGNRVQPEPGSGYLYLYSEDDLIHLCWRPRSAPATSPELDLITIPGDASFTPLLAQTGNDDDTRSPTNGRVFMLKFSSSGEKQYFWMQSKSLGGVNQFSERDTRLGQVVDAVLSGEEVDVDREIEDIRREGRGGGGSGNGGGGEDDLMDLDRQESGTGGAGADATGADPREEGEPSREGGADGGRAPQDTSAIVQNFLNSLNSGNNASQSGQSSQQQPQQMDLPYTTLPDLLTPATTLPFINAPSTSPAQIDALCALLPADLFLLAQESETSTAPTAPTSVNAEAAIAALSDVQKREILTRVVRSPQLQQSLGSLTVALRDGGLPMIGDALGLKVENGGAVSKGAQVPMGGGQAVKGFVEGVKRTVEEEEERKKGDQ